jgi:hypothetical protein
VSFTADFILLFILVVIPGLLFKRFFFFGEFSKQYTTKESIYKSIFYSIIPGIIIQLFAYLCYTSIRNVEFSDQDVITIFKELFSQKVSYSDATNRFFNKGVSLFLIHEFNVFILAGVLGLTFARLIRYFKWDIKFKIFRFQNQWYYIFSGEIRTFKKFKNSKQILGTVDGIEEQKKKSQTHFPPYGDILVENAGQQVLYTGFIIDYDLDYENLNNLDKIYLIGASRYREKREGENLTGLEVRGSRVKVPIKGNVFILQADKILNINLTFLPTETPKIEAIKLWEKIKEVIFYCGLSLGLLVIIYLVFINTKSFKDIFPLITDFVKDENWFSRFVFGFTILQILTLFMPSETEDQASEKTSENNENNPSLELEIDENKINLKTKEDKKISKYNYSWDDILIKVLISGAMFIISCMVLFID